ncbi:MAG: formylglycine-generating enzyme family protein, partial [Treponema sp.]
MKTFKVEVVQPQNGKIIVKKVEGSTETELNTSELLKLEENTKLKVSLLAIESQKYTPTKLKIGDDVYSTVTSGLISQSFLVTKDTKIEGSVELIKVFYKITKNDIPNGRLEIKKQISDGSYVQLNTEELLSKIPAGTSMVVKLFPIDPKKFIPVQLKVGDELEDNKQKFDRLVCYFDINKNITIDGIIKKLWKVTKGVIPEDSILTVNRRYNSNLVKVEDSDLEKVIDGTSFVVKLQAPLHSWNAKNIKVDRGNGNVETLGNGNARILEETVIVDSDMTLSGEIALDPAGHAYEKVEINAGGVKFNMINIPYMNVFQHLTGVEECTAGPFQLGETEVTQELYEKVMKENPTAMNVVAGISEEEKKQCPVSNISFYEACAFCNELTILVDGSEKECYYYADLNRKVPYRIADAKAKKDMYLAIVYEPKKGFRIPKEVEWELASLGGENKVFPGSDVLENVAWFSEDASVTSHILNKVAKKQKNGYGFY